MQLFVYYSTTIWLSLASRKIYLIASLRGGLAVGCGMYALSGICTVLVLLFLEVLNSDSIKLGDKEVNAMFSSPDEEAIKNALASLGRRVKDYSLSKQENGYKLEVVLHVPKKEYGVNLLTSLSSIPGVQLENFN